jgi:hypothetical protein
MATKEANNRFIIIGISIAVLVVLMWVGIHLVQNHYNWKRTVDDLERVYDALERYEDRNGSLPILSLYPADPLTGEDSIRFVLARYLVDLNVFVSPVGHREIQRTGLTYIWNPNLNRQRLGSFDSPQWVLTDIQALDADIKKAHRFGYVTLFSDGSVRKLDKSPFRLADFN